METTALSFARPEWLHALWLLPGGVLLFWWAEQRRRALLGRLVAPKLRALLAGSTSSTRRWFRAACVLTGLGLLFVTLAGPRMGYDTLELPHQGRDVVIAIDVSRSMLATDVAPTRLQRAKLLAEDLINELGGERLGLVAFAGTAFLQAPLTLDHGAVLAAVDELDTDLIPRGGTNIAAAIRSSEDAFSTAEGFSRAIILISDGEELDADGVAAARQAAAQGIRIFTVGLGSVEGSEIPLGPGEFVRDEVGQIVVTRLDVGRLTEIAETTGGFYTPLDEGALARLVTDGIGRMEAMELSAATQRRPVERYQWPLGGAIALLILQGLVGERRRRPWAVAAACWALAAPHSWAGLAAYEQGAFKEARQSFEERLSREPEAPALQFNAGTAAYRLRDFQKAAEYFSRAMLTDDEELRAAAEFNLGNTLFRLGEGQQDKEKTVTDWKEAIARYEEALGTRPDYAEARENKERVEELLRQLEEEQPEDETPDDEEQPPDEPEDQDEDDQEDQEDQQDQQEQEEEPSEGGDDGEDDQPDQPQDQDGNGEQPEDQEPGEDPSEEDPGEGEPEPGDDPSQEQNGEDGEDDRQPSEGDQRPEGEADRGQDPGPLPEPSDERKEGELQGAEDSGQPPTPLEAADAGEEIDGQMSEDQARALLRALEGEEEQVDLREQRGFHDVVRDW